MTTPEALAAMPPSWLETPPGAAWPTFGDATAAGPSPGTNPFIAWRRLLWSWHRAIDGGWSDADFVAMVKVVDEAIAVADGTGFALTPGSWRSELSGQVDVARLFVKDETVNVAGSHKARHLMGSLLHLVVEAISTDGRLAISSCGNAALAAATVAAAAGRPLDVFIPAWADPAVVAALDRLGATTHVCERRVGELGDPCMVRFRESVVAGAVPFGVQATENPWTLDGGRTIGWELASQLGSSGCDHVLVQVGGGALLTSTAIGLLEAAALGAIVQAPKVWAVQAAGCAPFDRAWRAIGGPDIGSERPRVDAALRDAAVDADGLMVAWANPHSAATGILDDETYDWLGVARSLLLTDGGSIVAAETDILAAATLMTRAGVDADATGSAGLAGLLAARRTGVIEPEESVAVLATGVRRA